MEILATSLPELPKLSKTFKKLRKTTIFRLESFRETDLFVFMDWTISDGSGGESYTVGRAESESEVEIAGKPQENQIFQRPNFKETDCLNDYQIFSSDVQGL